MVGERRIVGLSSCLGAVRGSLSFARTMGERRASLGGDSANNIFGRFAQRYYPRLEH